MIDWLIAGASHMEAVGAAGIASAQQPATPTPVIVTATFAKARPASVPPVKVMEPAPASPVRMFPLSAEVVMVAAPLGAQNTLHARPPPAMATEKLVPVRAPVTKNVQTPSADPVSVSMPVLAVASTQ